MSALRTTVVMCALAAPPIGTLASSQSEAVISNYDDRHVGWDSGRLAIHANDGTDALVVEFFGKRRQSLSRLTIWSAGGALDLSSVVQGLPTPFPSRSSIVVLASTSNGCPIDFLFQMPFQREPTENRAIQDECAFVSVRIRNGAIVDRKTKPAPISQCEH